MDTETLESVRSIFHYGSVVLLGFGIGLAVIGFFRPKAFARFFHEFSQRRFILLTAIFVGLLSGTIFTVTYPSPATLSNAPRPATQSENDLKDLEEEILPQGTAEAAQPVPTLPEPQTSPSKNTNNQIEPRQPGDEPVKWGDNKFTSKEPARYKQSDENQEQRNQDKDCNLELLFVCL
jgi:hypothetical protein